MLCQNEERTEKTETVSFFLVDRNHKKKMLSNILHFCYFVCEFSLFT